MAVCGAWPIRIRRSSRFWSSIGVPLPYWQQLLDGLQRRLSSLNEKGVETIAVSSDSENAMSFSAGQSEGSLSGGGRDAEGAAFQFASALHQLFSKGGNPLW